MEEILKYLLWVRVVALLTLTGLSLVSLYRFFRKQRKFGVGLFLVLLSLWISAIFSFFLGTDPARLISSVLYTASLTAWAILWTIDLGSYDDSKDIPDNGNRPSGDFPDNLPKD